VNEISFLSVRYWFSLFFLWFFFRELELDCFLLMMGCVFVLFRF